MVIIDGGASSRQVTELKRDIGEMTRVEVEEALAKGIDTVVVPLGAVEQHGPHGVLGTDSYCAQVVAGKVAKELGALLAPLMPYGMSSSHMNFKGTISLSPETFASFSKDVLSSLVHHGFKRVVVINGNEPNYYPLIMAARTLREETGAIVTVSNWYAALQDSWKELEGVKGTEKSQWKWPYFMAHGGLLETAGSMAYDPEMVRLDLATTYGSERREAFSNPSVSLPARIEEVAPQGSYGDPRDATAKMGKDWTDVAARKIAERVRDAWQTAAKKP